MVNHNNLRVQGGGSSERGGGERIASKLERYTWPGPSPTEDHLKRLSPESQGRNLALTV